MLTSLFGRFFGKKPAAGAKRPAEAAAPAAPAAKKKKGSGSVGSAKPAKAAPAGGGAMQRVPDMRRLRNRQALLFTCPTRQERRASAEAWALLRDYAERLAPAGVAAAPAAAPAATSGSLAAALAAEARSARSGGAAICLHDLGSAGLCYATVDPAVDVVRLVTSIFEDARDDPASPAAAAKLLVRLYPLQAVGYASLEGCLDAAAPLIAAAFRGLRTGPGAALLEAETARAAATAAEAAEPSKTAAKKAAKAAAAAAEDGADGDGDGDGGAAAAPDPVEKARAKAAAEAPPAEGDAAPRTYAVALKRRNADSFPKAAAIKALASLVPSQHTVDLTTPDVTILVEVFKSNVGVSVVPGYAAHHQFNLHAATGKQARPGPSKKSK